MNPMVSVSPDISSVSAVMVNAPDARVSPAGTEIVSFAGVNQSERVSGVTVTSISCPNELSPVIATDTDTVFGDLSAATSDVVRKTFTLGGSSLSSMESRNRFEVRVAGPVVVATKPPFWTPQLRLSSTACSLTDEVVALSSPASIVALSGSAGIALYLSAEIPSTLIETARSLSNEAPPRRVNPKDVVRASPPSSRLCVSGLVRTRVGMVSVSFRVTEALVTMRPPAVPATSIVSLPSKKESSTGVTKKPAASLFVVSPAGIVIEGIGPVV